MSDIFLKAPIWVWPLLLVLITLGYMQSRSRSVPPQRIIIIISAAMLCLSAYGVLTAFQGSVLALLVWFKLLGITLLICQKMGYPQGWQFDAASGRMQVPGSWLPMALFLGIFLTKLAVGAALAMRPALAHQLNVALPVSALYGLLSGIFAARAFHAFRISRQTPAQ